MRKPYRVLPYLLGAFILCMALPSFSQHKDIAVELEKVHLTEAYKEAESLFEKDDYKAAIKVITSAQAAGEDNFEMSQLLVQAYGERIDQVGMLKKRGLAVKLRKAMERSLELKPNDETALKSLIGFHLKAPGIVGGSKETARDLIQSFPNLSETDRLVYMARVASAEEDEAVVIKLLDEALDLDPQNLNAVIMRGNLYIENEDYAEAISIFESCVSEKVETMPCYYLIGKAAHVGDVESEKGIAALKTFVGSTYEDKGLRAHAHYRLGEIQVRLDKNELAKENFQTAISINELKLAKDALKALE